jgi:hypothetical protein
LLIPQSLSHSPYFPLFFLFHSFFSFLSLTHSLSPENPIESRGRGQ